MGNWGLFPYFASPSKTTGNSFEVGACLRIRKYVMKTKLIVSVFYKQHRYVISRKNAAMVTRDVISYDAHASFCVGDDSCILQLLF